MDSPMPRHARVPPLSFAIAALLIALAVTGCQRKGLEALLGSELFSLSLGRLEDQVDLFQPSGSTLEKKTRITMRDGLFYIANGSSAKIMGFTSYGDLIFLLYNPKTNPAPSLPALSEAGAGEVSTRGAVPFAFVDIGEIAIAGDKTLYVEDQISEAKAVKDADRGILLNRVVLRFDRKGKSLGYIGQEGVGGTPFPYIAGLHVTEKDQLVVVCRLPDSWQVFWYARGGSLLYRLSIDGAHLPVSREKGVTPSLVQILPDTQGAFLHLVIYLFRETPEESGRAQASVQTITSRVYRLNLRTRQYESFVELPRNPPRKEKSGLKTTEIPAPPSDVMGVGANGAYYLLGFSDSNLYALQVLDASGRVRARRYMVIEDSELTFRDLHLSANGIVYGLLCDQSRAHVTWWRSDLLLKGE
jgi:hypothetical protein